MLTFVEAAEDDHLVGLSFSRNNRIFDGRMQTIQDVLVMVADEIVAWYHAGFRCLEVAAGALGQLSGCADVTM